MPKHELLTHAIEFAAKAHNGQLRKQEALDHLAATSDKAVLMVCLGDKLSNIRAMERDYAELGDELWERFNQKDPAKHAWYYSSIASILEHALGDTAAWKEYNDHIRKVFGSF